MWGENCQNTPGWLGADACTGNGTCDDGPDGMGHYDAGASGEACSIVDPDYDVVHTGQAAWAALEHNI